MSIIRSWTMMTPLSGKFEPVLWSKTILQILVATLTAGCSNLTMGNPQTTRRSENPFSIYRDMCEIRRALELAPSLIRGLPHPFSCAFSLCISHIDPLPNNDRIFAFFQLAHWTISCFLPAHLDVRVIWETSPIELFCTARASDISTIFTTIKDAS